jgi:hypothetical protein
VKYVVVCNVTVVGECWWDPLHFSAHFPLPLRKVSTVMGGEGADGVPNKWGKQFSLTRTANNLRGRRVILCIQKRGELFLKGLSHAYDYCFPIEVVYTIHFVCC